MIEQSLTAVEWTKISEITSIFQIKFLFSDPTSSQNVEFSLAAKPTRSIGDVIDKLYETKPKPGTSSTSKKRKEGKSPPIMKCGACICKFQKVENCDRHKKYSETSALTCGQCGLEQPRKKRPKVSTDETGFRCIICSNREPTVSSLQRHLLNVHHMFMVRTHYQCLECFEPFIEKMKLIHHLDSSHGIDVLINNKQK